MTEFLTKATADQAFGAMKPEEVRRRMRELEELFPDADVGGPIGRELRDKAKGMFDEAKSLEKGGKPALAAEKGREAEKWDPGLPGLRAFLARVDENYPVLRVGVRELPKYMSPAMAYLPSGVK